MPPAPQLCFDTYRLDVPNQQLWRGSQALHLTAKAVRVYGWFTEGFDTADLQEANAFLEELW